METVYSLDTWTLIPDLSSTQKFSGCERGRFKGRNNRKTMLMRF